LRLELTVSTYKYDKTYVFETRVNDVLV